MYSTTVMERIQAKLTMGAANAISELRLNEHNLYCLLIAAEKNAGRDDVSRADVESAAQVLGIGTTIGSTNLVDAGLALQAASIGKVMP